MRNLTACILIGTVFAVGFVVAKEDLVNTFSISAREFAGRTDGLIGFQFRHRLTRHCVHYLEEIIN